MTTTPKPLVGAFELDPVHSTVQFAVPHAGVSTFRASFADVHARLEALDGAASLEGRVTAESVSIAAPPEFREHAVHSSDFLDADAHPVIAFRSHRVELDDDGAATVSGELSLRGVAREIRAAGTYRPPREDPFGTVRAGLELRTTIDRRHWGMSWQLPLPDGGDALGWEVEITAQLEFTRVD